jgi:putative tryptophan/tyrosine transport system substrate-binding protein
MFKKVYSKKSILMQRREFMAGIGSAMAWPFAAAGQQPALPVVGFVSSRSGRSSEDAAAAFRKGLNETGYVEGRNVTVEYHWLEGQLEQLRGLMDDLVRRRVAVIATPNSTLISTAAKAATTEIPILFSVGVDPIKTGLVASFARPGGNATGIFYPAIELATRRLELLHAMAPKAHVAILVNPANGPSVQGTLLGVGYAARSLGLQMKILNASTSHEIDAAFASLTHERADAVLFVGSDGFLQSRGEQLIALTARDKIPAGYPDRAAVEAGGLMAIDINADMYRRIGVYCSSILKGAKPADLPVQQWANPQLVINRKTAKALGLEIPKILMVAAEMID